MAEQNSSPCPGPTLCSHHLLPTCSCRNTTHSGLLLLSKHGLHLHASVHALPFLFPVKSSSWLQYYLLCLPPPPPLPRGPINHSLLFAQAAGPLRQQLHTLSLAYASTVLGALHMLSTAACHQRCREDVMSPVSQVCLLQNPCLLCKSLRLAATPSGVSMRCTTAAAGSFRTASQSSSHRPFPTCGSCRSIWDRVGTYDQSHLTQLLWGARSVCHLQMMILTAM